MDTDKLTGLVPALLPQPEMTLELAKFAECVFAAVGRDGSVETAWDVFSTHIERDHTMEEALAAVVANPLNRTSALVRITSPTAGRPIFMIPGGDGEPGWLMKPLTKVTVPRTVYGFNLPNWLGGRIPDSLPELARMLIGQMREVQPDGPYILGAYCIGVEVALEIARIIEASGVEVGQLVLVDPASDRTPRDGHGLVRSRLETIRRGKHAILAPYLALAERLSIEAVIEMLHAGRLPEDPVERRFVRGLRGMVDIAGAKRFPPTCLVNAPTAVLVTKRFGFGADGIAYPSLARTLSQLANPVEIVSLTAGHTRVFEDPALHDLLARH